MTVKTLYSIRNMYKIIVLIIVLSTSFSCNKTILEETPLSFLSPGALTNQGAFNAAIAGLHQWARQEDLYDPDHFEMWYGTDGGYPGEPNPLRHNDYSLITPTYGPVQQYWNYVYLRLIPNANMIINRAQLPEAVWSDTIAGKNAVIAEARFFRAYGYNILVNLFGGVPIDTSERTVPKVDYVRASKEDVLNLERSDLEFASRWLPATTKQDGRIVKAAADHLLAEVYLSLGRNDDAIKSASDVINSGLYHLMDQRFGVAKDLPGDVFSDLFKTGNYNRSSSGNMEGIWVTQIERLTPGGGNNDDQFAWNPRWWAITDPEGKQGMMLVTGDTLNRSAAWIRPTNHVFYGIWNTGANDIRNSKYNIKRELYYNYPPSRYYGQLVTYRSGLDTNYFFYPVLEKTVGVPIGLADRSTYKDHYKIRLAETYLLRAEAYMKKGDLVNAAADINVLHSRVNANPVSPGAVNLDYILDERLRELVTEEPRRRTLIRTGTLVRRVQLYDNNPRQTPNIQPFNALWPIPQSAIDANTGAELKQNPGY